MAVDPVVRYFWRDNAPEIKRLCAPSMPKGLIDQQQVFGFALAYGLGRPLLPHSEARTVGQAGDGAIRNANGTRDKAGPLKRAKEAAREAVHKATAAGTRDAALASGIGVAERKGTAAVAAVLQKLCNLKLPDATVGAKRRGVSVAEDPPAEEPVTTAELRVTARKAVRHQSTHAPRQEVTPTHQAHGNARSTHRAMAHESTTS